MKVIWTEGGKRMSEGHVEVRVNWRQRGDGHLDRRQQVNK